MSISLTDDWRLLPSPMGMGFLPHPLVEHFPLLSSTVGGGTLHNYLTYHRGVSEASYKWFGVRTLREDPHVLVFPFTNLLGNVIGLVLRNVITKKIRSLAINDWELPSKGKAGAWFGLGKLDVSKPALVVEGECFPGDAQVLTPNGWIELSSYSGERVLQVTEDYSSNFVSPSHFVKKLYSGDMVIKEVKGYFSKTTPKHKLVVTDHSGKLCKKEADAYFSQTHHIPRTTTLDGPGIPLSDDQLRFCVAVSADFSIAYRKGTGNHKPREKRGSHAGFKKQRKIDRVAHLLTILGITHSINPHKNGYTYVNVPLPDWVPGRLFPHDWIGLLSLHQKKVLLEELVLWDGNLIKNRKQAQYHSKYKENAIFVQTLAHTSGMCSSIISKHNNLGKWFSVSILYNKTTNSFQNIRSSKEYFEGSVYCVTVPSGMILVKQNDKITISGNCDAMVAHTHGFVNVLAAGGAGITKEQGKAIPSTTNVLLGLDSDKTGMESVVGFRKRLRKGVRVRVVNWSPFKDVGDIRDKDVFWEKVNNAAP